VRDSMISLANMQLEGEESKGYRKGVFCQCRISKTGFYRLQ
jgi:hypothetical protein